MNNAYTYYPGCSLKGTGRAYEESFLAVCKVLDVAMEELKDWNCCGATAYMAVDETKALSLAARNLALAEQEKRDIVAPCSGCYLVLEKSRRAVQDYKGPGDRVRSALKSVGLSYKGRINVRHPLDVFVNDIGLEAIREKIKKPLTGLKIAPYYGCQIVRPYSTFDDQIYPVTMDRLFETLGAEVVDYPLKTRCCGGSLTGTIPEVGQRLSVILLREARKKQADLMATCCPLCQFNLDSYQDEISARFGESTMPVVYFTQLMGLAFGLSAEELGLKRNIVPATPVLAQLQLASV
jgi:heterodisulfide reductase subunit B